MRTAIGAIAVNIAKPTNLSACMIDAFLSQQPNDKLEDTRKRDGAGGAYTSPQPTIRTSHGLRALAESH